MTKDALKARPEDLVGKSILAQAALKNPDSFQLIFPSEYLSSYLEYPLRLLYRVTQQGNGETGRMGRTSLCGQFVYLFPLS